MTAGVFVVLALSVALSFMAQPVVAATGINKQVSFQGKVVNTDGTNVTNGTYTFVFKIYNVSTGGTALWTETKSLTVTDGIFQTNLGSSTSLPGSVDFNTDSIYLGITFNSDGEMSPRVQFTAVPYAFNSDTLDGIDSTGFAQLNPGSAQSGSLNVSGSVAAATSLQAPVVDTATATALTIGGTNASSITMGKTTAQISIQGNSSSSFSATSGANTTTVGFTTPTGTNSILFPNAGGTVCTTVATTCNATYQAYSATGYLAKNAADTSSANVTGVLLGLTNTSTNSDRVLDLTNQGTGSTLNVVANANPVASAALIKATNQASSPSGDLLELWRGATNVFSVGQNGAVTQVTNAQSSNAYSIAASSLTTGSALKVTSASNAAANTNWSAVQINATNAQGTTAVTGLASGFDVQYTQNTTVAGNNETVANFAVAANSSSSTDATVNSIINVANNDDATGNQITATNGLLLNGANVTNGINFNGTFGTNLITSSTNNFVVTQAGLVTIGSVGTASNATYVCRNGSNQLAACNTTGSGTAFVQGGNTLGAAADFGTNDGYGLNIRTNNATRLTVSTTGDLTWAAGSAGNFDQSSSSGTFKTGTGAVYLNGDTTIATSKNLTVTSGTVNVGNTAGSGSLVNNGSTVNTVYTMANLATGGWDAGGAAATVDKYTYIAAAQTATGQTLTPPTPTASTTYGRLAYVTNTGSASFTMLGTTIGPGSTATLVWALVNGVAKWTFAGADGSGILNQNAAQQSGSFWISGNGQIDGKVLTPAVDTSAAGTLSLGTTNATTINIGTNAVAHTIAIGTDSTTVQGLTIGSTYTGSTTSIQSPTLTVGSAGASIFKNLGATYNATCDYTSVGTNTTLNTASKTPDVCTVFRITDTAAVTITVPNPAAGAGSVVFVSNMAASTNPITLLGALINAGSTATLVYNGTAWTFAGADANGLQTAYNNSGTSDPQIQLSNTNGGLKIRDAASSTIGNLLQVADSGGTNVYFAVTSTATNLTGNLSFTKEAARTISVASSTTNGAAGAQLTVQSAAGAAQSTAAGTAGAGGLLQLAAGNGGSGSVATANGGKGGNIAIQGGTGGAGNGAATNGNGGDVMIAGGTAGTGGTSGVPTGGALNLKGGAASATAGSTSGTASLSSQGGAGGSGTTAGGAAGQVSVTGGAGGNGGAASAAGGAGGAVAITSGTGGAGGTTGGAGSSGANVTITAGNGGQSYGTAAGSNGGNITLQAGSAGAVGTGTAGTAGSINLQGNFITAGTAGSSLFTNNAATLNTALAIGDPTSGYMGASAAATVNVYTAFAVTPTAAGRTYSVYSPTNGTGAGRVIYVSNASAIYSFSLTAGSTGVINPGVTATLVWNGTAWSFAGADAGNLQTAYNNSVGDNATPSIAVSTTKKGLFLQNSATNSLGNTAELLSVRSAAANDTTAGAAILSVTSNGVSSSGVIGINLGTGSVVASGADVQFGSIAAGTSRVIQVQAQTTANTAGGNLQVIAATGNGTGAGGSLLLNGGVASATAGSAGGAVSIAGGAGSTTGTGAAGGAVTIQGGNSGGTGANAGGAVTITGGTASGTAAGGLATLQGGAASATAGSAGGGVAIYGVAGSTTGTGGVGGSITIQAGNGGGTGTSNGGGIRLTAGTASGTGVPGVVQIDQAVFTNVGVTYTQTAGGQAFPTAGAQTTTLQTNVDSYSTISITMAGAYTGATVTIPSPTNTAAIGRILYISNTSTSTAAFTLASTGMKSVLMSANSTAMLVWNGTYWASSASATSLQDVYNNTSSSPAGIITTSATKNILFQAGVGFDNTNVFQIGNSAGATIFTVDTTNTATGTNLAVNGGAENAFGGEWVAFGGGGTPSRDTNALHLAAGLAAVSETTAATAGQGVENKLGAALPTGTYIASFSVKLAAGTWANSNLQVDYYRDTSTKDSSCNAAAFTGSYVPTINTSTWIKYSCSFTVTTLGTANAYLAISQLDATARTFYIDNLNITPQNTSGTQDVGALRVGGALSQGLNLLTLDSFSAAPFSGVNPTLLGSMYYDTTQGRIQCYEQDGWGSCGSAPNNNFIDVPEYSNAVLSAGTGTDAHIGTMTAGMCSGSSRLGIQPSEGTVCAASEEYNYYRWTSGQTTPAQSYSLIAKYQLPPYYKDLISSSTLQLIGRVSSTTDATIQFSVYGNTGTQCGSTTSVANGAANTWSAQALSGVTVSGSSYCGWVAGDIVTFKIDVTSKNNAYAYISNITFSMTGK